MGKRVFQRQERNKVTRLGARIAKQTVPMIFTIDSALPGKDLVLFLVPANGTLGNGQISVVDSDILPLSLTLEVVQNEHSSSETFVLPKGLTQIKEILEVEAGQQVRLFLTNGAEIPEGTKIGPVLVSFLFEQEPEF